MQGGVGGDPPTVRGLSPHLGRCHQSNQTSTGHQQEEEIIQEMEHLQEEITGVCVRVRVTVCVCVCVCDCAPNVQGSKSTPAPTQTSMSTSLIEEPEMGGDTTLLY